MATPIPINQCEFTIAEVVEATGGTFVAAKSTDSFGDDSQGERPPPADAVASKSYRTGAGSSGNVVGVSIDTRSIRPVRSSSRYEAPHGRSQLSCTSRRERRSSSDSRDGSSSSCSRLHRGRRYSRCPWPARASSSRAHARGACIASNRNRRRGRQDHY